MSQRNSRQQERDEFQSILPRFCSRFIHGLMHSRLNVPMDQPCNPYDDEAEWFNFKQDEFGEVAAYMKKINLTYPPFISTLSLDFILRTASGDNLPLESWVIRVSDDEVDENVNISSQLYLQLGGLLKSVCAAARATPAARHYTRTQSEKTHIICYRINESEPDLELLGPEARFVRLGHYPSPFGAVDVELHYRTRMELFFPPYADAVVKDGHPHADATGIFTTASIPIQKPPERKIRLLQLSEQSSSPRNWSNALTDEIPFVSDLSKPRLTSPVGSPESDSALPTIYQNLPAEVLAAMPTDLRAGQRRASESEPFPMGSSVSLKKRESFPFSILSRDSEEEQMRIEAESPTLSNFRFPMNVNSSGSTSSGSKRFDSDGSNSSITGSVRDLIRQKQRKNDELFGFVEEDESGTETTAIDPPVAANPEPFAIPDTELGADLDAFVTTMSHPAPLMGSFKGDDGKWLSEKLEFFKQRASNWDDFVSSMSVADGKTVAEQQQTDCAF